MRKKIFFGLLLSIQFGYSQENKISKTDLFKIFNETINQKDKAKINTNSNPWFTDNTDEAYFKKDTITLKNAKSFKRNYCKVIKWNFYKKDSFIIGNADYCNEPPSQKVTTINDWIKLNVEEVNNYLIIELFNQNKIIDKFKILTLEKRQSEYDKENFEYILKLKRISE